MTKFCVADIVRRHQGRDGVITFDLKRELAHHVRNRYRRLRQMGMDPWTARDTLMWAIYLANGPCHETRLSWHFPEREAVTPATETR